MYSVRVRFETRTKVRVIVVFVCGRLRKSCCAQLLNGNKKELSWSVTSGEIRGSRLLFLFSPFAMSALKLATFTTLTSYGTCKKRPLSFTYSLIDWRSLLCQAKAVVILTEFWEVACGYRQIYLAVPLQSRHSRRHHLYPQHAPLS